MALKLKVTKVKSGINRPEPHKLALKSLGLTRMHKTVILNDTPAIRGMIRKVSHLVRVEPAE
jgi:large subunit ribosomal protein L30